MARLGTAHLGYTTTVAAQVFSESFAEERTLLSGACYLLSPRTSISS